jgi:hypothetical protein
LSVEGNQIRIETVHAAGWNPQRFWRSLHYLGLNHVALTEGVAHVLDDRFDAVRRYVKAARSNERWEYGEEITVGKLLPRLHFECLVEAPGKVVLMQIFNVAFFVNLIKTAEFEKWLGDSVPSAAIV